MKLTRQTMSNIAIALVAVALFAGFVILATKGGDKNNGDLAAVAPTSTSEPTTTTELPTTTTTESTLLLPTTTVPVTATTKVTTATTAKPRATTTTAHGACAHGPATEQSDNKDTFNYGTDGWTSDSTSAQPGSSTFPLTFTITTSKGTSDPHNIKFEVKLTNTTACTATFGSNLVVAMTLRPTGGGDAITFTISPPAGSEVTDIKAGETITLKQERALSGSGTFDATGACDINYG